MPADGMLKELAQDFKKMQDSGMFHGAVPTFDSMINDLRSCEQLINLINESVGASEPSETTAETTQTSVSNSVGC